MPTLNQIKIGQALKLRLSVLPARVQTFKFAKECDDVGGGLMPGTELVVVEVHPLPHEQWVRVKIPGSDPAKHLKLAGGEVSGLIQP